eukprot:CAMPEP_0179254636 /NCGR_PEP_ID=MMETSP0797-20121207/23337_1 /TAXON_ID=47934 /ORGANISM="Dinophysis acuminata, Strain DAEP01" /LENGTH=41 /DNA_ID= /DNA_START= /DNA_END= /DNA_ORIENTATION=
MEFPIRAVCNVGPGGKPCGGGSDAGNVCGGTVTFEQVDADT